MTRKRIDNAQRAFLRGAKTKLKLTWDAFALRMGAQPRAFKTYRMPEASMDYRAMPESLRLSIVRALAEAAPKAAAPTPGRRC